MKTQLMSQIDAVAISQNEVASLWRREEVVHPPDACCGATIVQLTSHIKMATSIYCEDPFCSAVCGRIVVCRMNCPFPERWQTEIWVIDPSSRRSCLIESQSEGWACGVAQHAYSDFFFYSRLGANGDREWVRLCLSTLKKQVVAALNPYCMLAGPGSVSPDSRFIVFGTNPKGRLYQSGIQQVLVVDVENGQSTVIAEGEDLINPHPRFDRVNGERVLIQQNRGQRWMEGRVADFETYDASLGATLFLAHREGGGRQELPIARPNIPHRISGHEAWVKGEMEFLYSSGIADGCYNDGRRSGNLLSYHLGDKRPRVVAHDPGTYYGHVSTSFCGKYWVCDAWSWNFPQPLEFCVSKIVIGSINSGKFSTLCDVGALDAIFEEGHAHPYMTADNQRVIFGSMRTGTPQVYAAEIPKGFLDALA
ncbi:MAG: hypothetical protein PHV34_14285 [Verrucomicrobiae bacterium]|nr:hypothetical protein [Verrucomicrobiae bacterium]